VTCVSRRSSSKALLDKSGEGVMTSIRGLIPTRTGRPSRSVSRELFVLYCDWAVLGQRKVLRRRKAVVIIILVHADVFFFIRSRSFPPFCVFRFSPPFILISLSIFSLQWMRRNNRECYLLTQRPETRAEAEHRQSSTIIF